MRFRTWLETWNAPKNDVDPDSMPPVIYHVTPFAAEIKQTGFKPSYESGRSMLGGSSGDAVSFTNRENAENYWEGMEIARRAQQGEYQFDDVEMMLSIGSYAGFAPKDVYRMYEEVKQDAEKHGYINDDGKKMFELFQKFAMYGTRSNNWKAKKGIPPFPLFMGSEVRKTLGGVGPMKIVSVSSRGPQRIKTAPTEQEWKIYDPENLDISTIEILDPLEN